MSPRIPDSVRSGVRDALRAAGSADGGIAEARPVGGGCINPSARVQTTDGRSFFLKWNRDHPALFAPEARGLEALARAARGTPLRVPEVVGSGAGDGGTPGWLLLEYVPEGSPSARWGEELGRGLAALHRDRGHAFGWSADNFIGSLPQSNRRRPSWADFWIEERLQPQLERARRAGHDPGGAEAWKELFRRMPRLVGPADDDGPSLLHGDLWSGNVYPGPDGEPVLVDPAVYRGHREVDLAMTELFGGFPGGFAEAYDEAWPLADGYRSVRRHLYQLYPLLVHVNLFGGGYVGRTRSALERVLSA